MHRSTLRKLELNIPIALRKLAPIYYWNLGLLPISLPAILIFPYFYWKKRFFFTFFRLWAVGPQLTRCSLIPFLSNEPLVRLSCTHMYRSPWRVFTIDKQNAWKVLQIYFWTLVQSEKQKFNILKFSTFLFLVKIWNSFL